MTFAASLEDFARRHPAQALTTGRFLELLRRAGDAAYQRDYFLPGHITGSAWVLDSSHQRALLTHHRKLGIWVQPGGHCDGGPDAKTTALREAKEETGLESLALVSDEIFDLDIHEIPARKQEPAHLHYDVRYLVVAHPGEESFTVSAESHDLAWTRLEAVAGKSSDVSVRRMAERTTRARSAAS